MNLLAVLFALAPFSVPSSSDHSSNVSTAVWVEAVKGLPAKQQRLIENTIYRNLADKGRKLNPASRRQLKKVLAPCLEGNVQSCLSDAAAVLDVEYLIHVRSTPKGRQLDLQLSLYSRSKNEMVASLSEASLRAQLTKVLKPLTEQLWSAAAAAIASDNDINEGASDGAPEAEIEDAAIAEQHLATGESTVSPDEQDGAGELASEAEDSTDDAQLAADAEVTDWLLEQDDGWVLHAEAVLAEAQGDLSRAHELMSRALTVEPDDPDIRYDYQRFFPQQTLPASQLEVGATVPHQADTSKKSQWLQGYLALGMQADSNMSLLPDELMSGAAGDGALSALGAASGMRGTIALGLSATMLKGQPLEIVANTTINHGSVVAGRDNPLVLPALLDSTAGEIGLAVRLKNGPSHWTLRGRGLAVRLDGMREGFMNQGAATLDWRMRLGAVVVGAAADSGYNHFDFGNLAGPTDRTGSFTSAGLHASYRYRLMTVFVRAGGRGEFAQGVRQQVRGAEALALVNLDFNPLTVRLDGFYEHRDYFKSAAEQLPRRVENRITPGVSLLYNVTDYLALRASYRLFVNIADPAWAFTRHLASTGVEMRWQ